MHPITKNSLLRSLAALGLCVLALSACDAGSGDMPDEGEAFYLEAEAASARPAEADAETLALQGEPAVIPDPEARGQQAYLFLRSGDELKWDVSRPAGASEIIVRTRALAYEGDPILEFEAAGRTVSRAVSSGDYTEVSFGVFALDGEAKLRFANDLWGGSADRDRNVIVDYVLIRRAPAEPDRPEGPNGPVGEAALIEAAKAYPAMPRDSVDLLTLAPSDFTFGSGTPFNDLEYTLFDTNYMEGETGGYDTFYPVDPSDDYPGADTVRLVRGVNNLDLEMVYDGPAGDRIILGSADVSRPFFLRGADEQDNDYAVIQNYDYNHGHIQLRGAPEDYGLVYLGLEDGVETEGHYLFYTAGGEPDLVAFIFPCDDLGETVSGNPPRDDQVLCNAERRVSLTDGVNFRFALPFPASPSADDKAVQLGTPGKEIVGAVVTDAEGNSYILGASDGGLTSSPEAGDRIFVAQHDRVGRRGWTFELPMSNGTLLFDGAADSEHLYMAGRTLGALPGFSNQGRWDGILLKLRLSDGELVASNQFGNGGLDGYGNIVLDGRGSLYVSGAGSPEKESGTDASYLVAKHDADTLENVWRVIEPPAGQRIFVSEAWGGVSYAPGDTPAGDRLIVGGWYMSAGGADGFLSVYEELNAAVPARVATASLTSPGQQADWVLDNAVDAEGNIYAAGYTTGVLGAAHQGDGDAFIVKYAPDLTDPQFVQVGTSQSDMFRKLEFRGGELFAVGYTYGDYRAGRYQGENLDPEKLSGDVLVQKFSTDLDLLEALQFGTAGEDRAYPSLQGDSLYLGGMTEASLAGLSAGSFDAFVARIDRATLTP